MNDAFDRVRPRTAAAGPAVPAPADHEGKRALFSDAVQPPSPGSVALTCSACGERSVVSVARLARLSLPGLHLPVPSRRSVAWRAFLRCPACDQRAWASLRVR